MKNERLMLCAFVAGIGLAACSAPSALDTDNSLKAATAEAVPQSDPGKIEILSKELQKAKWVWQAKVDGKTFDCDADDQMRLPSCQAAG